MACLPTGHPANAATNLRRVNWLGVEIKFQNLNTRSLSISITIVVMRNKVGLNKRNNLKRHELFQIWKQILAFGDQYWSDCDDSMQFGKRATRSI